jgi:hypothetical protein
MSSDGIEQLLVELSPPRLITVTLRGDQRLKCL